MGRRRITRLPSGAARWRSLDGYEGTQYLDPPDPTMADARNAARGRGRPPKITERAIVEAVLAEGFAGLTVPAVAKRLRVTTMTLYRHVATRADLLALAWDHVLDAYAWPSHDLPWRELLHAHATALWDLLAEHPGSVTELSGAVMPPHMIGMYDGLAVALVTQGFTADVAVLTVDSVIDLTIEHRRGVELLARSTEGDAASLHDQLAGLWAPSSRDTPPRREVRQAMSRAIATPSRDWFCRKLNLILDGVAQHRCDEPTARTNVARGGARGAKAPPRRSRGRRSSKPTV